MLTLVFVLVRVVPGDPASPILGDQASPEALAALRDRLGVDKPILRAVRRLPRCRSLRGDLGRSLVTQAGRSDEVAAVLPYTIDLTLAAIVLGSSSACRSASWPRARRNGLIDYVARIVSLLGLSFPAFVSGILLLLAFAIQLRWFPGDQRRRWTIPSSDCARSRCRPSISASSWRPT